MWLDLSIIVVFLLANLLIGVWSSKKNVDLTYFSVGHRSFGSFVIFATLSASFIGGGYTIGNASKVYSIGIIYSFALLGFSFKEILVASFVAPRMDVHRDCLSIGDIIAKRYGRNAKIITGILAMLLCAGILGAQVGAMGAIFESFFKMNPLWGIIVGFSVMLAYSTFGGMHAVVYTDLFQFIILMIGIPLIFFFGVHYVGGFSQWWTQIPTNKLFFLHSFSDYLFFISLFLTFVFGETLVPPYVQRLFMAKTARHTKRATLASALISIPVFLMVGSIGLIAFVMNPNLMPDTALPDVVNRVLPPVIKSFVIVGLLSIIMSSASSFLNSGAISFVNDVLRPLSKKNLSDHTWLRLAKFSTFIVGAGAIAFALMIQNVLDILLYAYRFWAPIILVPLLAVIFNFRVFPRDFMAGAIGGVIATMTWTIIFHSEQSNPVVIGVFANAICFTLSRLLSKKRIFPLTPSETEREIQP